MTLNTVLRLTAATLVLGAGLPAFAADPQEGETLAESQTFTYRLLDEVPTLDPQLNEDVSGSNVQRDLFEGLMNQDAQGNLVPGVATGYTATDGNKTYVFTLREEAKWSNGDPVTAQDFVYAWRRAIDPATASPYAWFVEMTTMTNASKILAGELPPEELGVEAVDDHTLKVTLEESIPYFAAMTTTSTLFPAPQATIEKFGSEWTRPGNMVSNGAYVLSEHVPNEYHKRIKNDQYWDAGNVHITEVTGLVINDVNQALTRYLAGELDMIEPLPAGQFPELKEKYPDQATSVPRLCNYYYTFNMTDSANPALKDVRVREAMSYAIDRDVIVNAVLKGGQSPAYIFTPPFTAGFEAEEPAYQAMTQKERDAEAVRLIEEAGYGKDHPLTLRLIYNTDENHKKIATVMAQMWKQKLGIDVTMQNFEWKTFLEIRKQQDFDVARGAWCGDYNEASTFLQLMVSDNSQNDGRFANDEVDALMMESKTMADPNPNYAKVEEILEQEVPVIPVYHYANVFMLNAAIKGWPYENVENNWYSKDFYKVAE
ncbi:peptide ABC transporter substrate-binding protein [Mangrovicoccus sp. HB161399]|uniref:peptide ABC transporter substrate-binding protein n=1 Tax=Mangrovicoccus sp. HB161399 TaxID=2720392 RepID=UPI001553C659|nr:peptide ABC transporter substrate-binding protein [Mangrovicoccus sp. HB161399]